MLLAVNCWVLDSSNALLQDMYVITGANICFGMQSIQLKPHMSSMGEGHTELSPQLMLIHLTSATSQSSNVQDHMWEENSHVKVCNAIVCISFATAQLIIRFMF